MGLLSGQDDVVGPRGRVFAVTRGGRARAVRTNALLLAVGVRVACYANRKALPGLITPCCKQ